MLKKFLIATLLGASLSFATWGYFPLKDSDAGFEVRANHYIGFGDSDPHYISADARYVLGTTLEFSLQNVGIQLSDKAGLQNLLLGIRFQMGKGSLLFGEVTLPIGEESQPEFFHAGYQQAFLLKKHAAWSSELGYTGYFKQNYGGIEETRASKINFATEMDFNKKPNFIWFVGTKMDINVLKSEYTDDSEYYYDDGGDDASDFIVKVFGGASYEIRNNMYLQEEIDIPLAHSGETYKDEGFSLRTSLKFDF